MKKFLLAIVCCVLCVGNVFARETAAWPVLDSPTFYESGQTLATRKIIFPILCAGMFISAILALLKKISWFWLFSLFGWLSAFGMYGLITDYILEEEKITDYLIPLLFLFLFYLLPILVCLMQYKFKKTNKKQLKHRLWIWFSCGLLVGFCAVALWLLSLFV